METREILSLQFGHYTNFIGTHSWNIQESSFEYASTTPSEINHDVLFREGLTPKGEITFTPRLLLVDLKGSLKTLPEAGHLYEPPLQPNDVNVWSQNVEIQTATEENKNQFQKELDTMSSDVLTTHFNLDDDVEVWSDFLYTRFHPRTVNIINEYHHGGDSQFDVFPLGTKLWESEQFLETFADKIRNYVEECDSFQGFHVTLDATNGFSGLASACLEYVCDEYERKSVLAFPVIPSYYSSCEDKPVKDSHYLLNLALTFDALKEQSSLFVPLCTGETGWRQPGLPRQFHHVSYKHQLPYHSSAILASALDTFTLKHRLSETRYSLSDLCSDLNGHGRRAAAASVCLPFSFNEGADFIDCLNNWEGPLTQSITPNCSIGTDKLIQAITLRGIPEDRLKRPLSQADKQRTMPAYNCKSVHEMLSYYLSCNYYLCLNNITSVSKGLCVKTPYPNIFDEFVGVHGNICSKPRVQPLVVESIPMLAGLHSGDSLGSMIESLHGDVKKIKLPHIQQFISAGLEEQELTECFDRLLDFKECYEDDYI